jgi:hypothetical protein
MTRVCNYYNGKKAHDKQKWGSPPQHIQHQLDHLVLRIGLYIETTEWHCIFCSLKKICQNPN